MTHPCDDEFRGHEGSPFCTVVRHLDLSGYGTQQLSSSQEQLIGGHASSSKLEWRNLGQIYDQSGLCDTQAKLGYDSSSEEPLPVLSGDR